MWYHTVLNNIQWRLRKHLMIQQCVISELWVIFGNTHTGTHTDHVVVSSKKQQSPCSFSRKLLSKQNLDLDLLFKKIKHLTKFFPIALRLNSVLHTIKCSFYYLETASQLNWWIDTPAQYLRPLHLKMFVIISALVPCLARLCAAFCSPLSVGSWP